MYKIFVVAFLLIFAGNVFAQDTTQLKLPPNVKSGSKTLTDLIAEKGQTKIGLLTIHKIDDRLGIPLKLTRRSGAIWQCVPLIFDQGVPRGLTSCSGAN